MSRNTSCARQFISLNNENPVKNIKNSLISDRKKSALKVLTNTVQSIKKHDSINRKQFKVLPMKNFDTEVKHKSSSHDVTYNQNEKFDHFECISQEKDILPSSMTCNIGMLSNFFSRKDDESDWFLEDYNNIMNNKIKNIFEHFGESEPVMEYSFSSLPIMDFPEINLSF